MKAFDILEQASLLAGGTAPDESLKAAGISLINTVLCDLGTKPVRSLADEPLLPSADCTTALINGVSMLICSLQGDDAGLACFNEMYLTHKKKLLCGVRSVRNTLFGGEAV